MKRKLNEKLNEEKTLNVRYKDGEGGKNLEKIANYLSRGVFIKQKKKENEINKRMFLFCDRKKRVLECHSISFSSRTIFILEGEKLVVKDIISKTSLSDTLTQNSYLEWQETKIMLE